MMRRCGTSGGGGGSKTIATARLGLYEVRLEERGIFLQLEPSGTKENAPNEAGQRAYYNGAKRDDGEK